jgi:hypothetical protein
MGSAAIFGSVLLETAKRGGVVMDWMLAFRMGRVAE